MIEIVSPTGTFVNMLIPSNEMIFEFGGNLIGWRVAASSTEFFIVCLVVKPLTDRNHSASHLESKKVGSVKYATTGRIG